MRLLNRAMKNTTIGVKVLDDRTLNGGAEVDSDYDPMVGVQVAAAYAEIAKDLVTHTALTVGGVWAACKIIGRICK